MTKQNHTRSLLKENYANVDELYQSISKEGSLGLLALGYKGLMLWRKKRAELAKEFPPSKNNSVQNAKEEK